MRPIPQQRDRAKTLAIMLAETDGVVWVDSYGRHALWCERSEQALASQCSADPPTRQKSGWRLKWEDDGWGLSEEIGTLDKRPLVLHLSWATIDGQRILFVEFISAVADYQAGEAWLKKRTTKLKKLGDGGQVDGMNFDNALRCVEKDKKHREALKKLGLEP